MAKKRPKKKPERFIDMRIAEIQKLLEESLINDGKMYYALYEHELEELLEYLENSMREDMDEIIFAVTENSGHTAMVVIDKSGEIYINELARNYLKDYWGDVYLYNMNILIPTFAEQLSRDQMPINGFKVMGELFA